MDLKQSNTRPATKLALWNTSTGVISGYDGKVLSQQSLLSPEMAAECTAEELAEALEFLRLSSVAGTIEKNTLQQEAYRKQYGYADDEMGRWWRRRYPTIT